MKKIVSIIILALLTFVLFSVAKADESSSDYLIFILAGQSNMSGRAAIPKNYIVNENIFLFDNAYHLRKATNPIDSGYDQVDMISYDKNPKFSIGIHFANRLSKLLPNLKIILVPCAKGATSILDWQRDLSENSLYGSCLKRILAVSPNGKLEGLLFIQGEKDSLSSETSQAWDSLFETFVNDLRRDLSYEIPVYYAQIHCPIKTGEFWETVQEKQVIAENRINNSKMIKTCDIANTNLHYSTQETRRIGNRFALNVYNNLK